MRAMGTVNLHAFGISSSMRASAGMKISVRNPVGYKRISTRRLRVVTALVVLLSLHAGLVDASQVRPLNLEQMTARAATIFWGRCTQVTMTRDAETGLPVTEVTYQVQRSVKGRSARTLTVRTLGLEMPMNSGPLDGLVPQSGEEVVLFLYGENHRGLTSTVGRGLGRFSVVLDKDGRKRAVNGARNRNLLHGFSSLARRKVGRPERLDSENADLAPTDLLDVVETLLH